MNVLCHLPRKYFSEKEDFVAAPSILGLKLSERGRTWLRKSEVDTREQRFIDLFSRDEMEC
ncbi:hypothetical protein NXC12_PB00088 (plasmid) [Rhizobium etli]|uniref:Uncharacterized protein n=1 Tax=Rhizobium etli TaxID=29449 RepID=A0AAN1EM61_RHIET|nr:hypothetical protein [Rhizobium etli]ARQ12492.1 hypothetical protein NXC12_PB00088 [Rhizobium etli]